MTLETVLIAITTPDKPGVIRTLSQTVRQYNGNWTESSFTALEGVFVGVVKLEVPAEKKDALCAALNQLSDSGIAVSFPASALTDDGSKPLNSITLNLEANDRAGIIEEITTALANADINIVDLQSDCESASMAGYNLFNATIIAALPAGMSREQLVTLLEHISDDVMVTVEDSAS